MNDFLYSILKALFHASYTLVCIAITYFITAANERVRIMNLATKLHNKKATEMSITQDEKKQYMMALKDVTDEL